MLEKLLGNMEMNYAVNLIRRLETMNFSSKALAEEYFKITYDMVRQDLHGIEVNPIYKEKMTICVEGKNTGKRYNVWTVRVPMIKRQFETIN